MKPKYQTRLFVRNRDFDVIFSIRSRLPLRFRRQMALQIFKAVKPTLRAITESYAVHEDAHLLTFLNASTHPLGLKETAAIDRPGLRIRLRRLEIGLTLRELAKLVKIDYSQLSKIERGLCLPQPRTLSKLERLLSPKCVPKNQPNPTFREQIGGD